MQGWHCGVVRTNVKIELVLLEYSPNIQTIQTYFANQFGAQTFGDHNTIVKGFSFWKHVSKPIQKSDLCFLN